MEVPADVLRADLFELRLAVVEVDLYLSLNEEVPALLDDPLTEAVADTDAEVDEVG